MQNKEIAEIFDTLADLLEIEGENPFKVRAYRQASRAIRSLYRPLEEMVRAGEDLTKLPKIGSRIAQKIEEIVRTGKLSKLEKLKSRIPESLLALLPIQGLGPKRIKMLYDALHIDTKEALLKAAKEHKISQIKGFGAKTEAQILEALTMRKQQGLRFLFCEAEPYADALTAYLQKAPTLRRVTIAGSYRRKKETVGDLDIVASATDPREVIDYFTKFEKSMHTVLAGDTRATIVLENGLQVDLRVVLEESWGSALHYFTGSKDHVIRLRQEAVEMGLKVNEYGIYRADKRITGESEEAVYRSFGLDLIPPELRENRGEIEAARNHTLPHLITPNDIQGDLHLHTHISDGEESLEAVARQAISLGYRYIAITEHSRSLPYTKGAKSDQLNRLFDEIETWNRDHDELYIFKGAEIEILQDGSLDIDEAVLDRLDLALGAIHTHFSLSKKSQTDRLLKAIHNPHINIIAHPTGRLIQERNAMEIDLETIYRASAQTGTILEINAQPKRLDLNDIQIKHAKQFGVKFSIASDAHSTAEMRYLKYGIHQARRGWLEKEDVINALPLKELKSTLKSVSSKGR